MASEVYGDTGLSDELGRSSSLYDVSEEASSAIKNLICEPCVEATEDVSIDDKRNADSQLEHLEYLDVSIDDKNIAIQEMEGRGLSWERDGDEAQLSCKPTPDDRVESDDGGEMDVISLVRMKSALMYGEDPIMPSSPILRRTSSGCSCGQPDKERTPAEINAAVVLIQRTVRSRSSSRLSLKRPEAKTQKEPPKKPNPKKPKNKDRIENRPAWGQGGKSSSQTEVSALLKKNPIQTEASSLLKKRSLEYISRLDGGVILLTAPHSIKLTRGGAATGDKSRIHKRERYTAEVVLKIAAELEKLGIPTAIMIWNRASGHKKMNLDPNYLVKKQYRESPWHAMLHQWISNNKSLDDRPLFHVDIHGKYSAKKFLDLGMVPLESEWPGESETFVAALKESLTASLGSGLMEREVTTAKKNPIQVDPDPSLHGFWGYDTVTTISHQSVNLGVPAVQLEMPHRVREKVVFDSELARLFAESIATAYRDCVVPWWEDGGFGRAGSGRLEGKMEVDPKAGRGCIKGAPFVPVRVPQREFDEWAGALIEGFLDLERSSAEIQI